MKRTPCNFIHNFSFTRMLFYILLPKGPKQNHELAKPLLIVKYQRCLANWCSLTKENAGFKLIHMGLQSMEKLEIIITEFIDCREERNGVIYSNWLNDWLQLINSKWLTFLVRQLYIVCTSSTSWIIVNFGIALLSYLNCYIFVYLCLYFFLKKCMFIFEIYLGFENHLIFYGWVHWSLESSCFV